MNHGEFLSTSRGGLNLQATNSNSNTEELVYHEDHRAKPRGACRKRLLSFAMNSVGKEFETIEAMKLSTLYDLVEWVVWI